MLPVQRCTTVLTTQAGVSTKLQETLFARAKTVQALAVGHFQGTLFVDHAFLPQKSRCIGEKRTVRILLIFLR